MAIFTIENDKEVREHLATLATALRAKFKATAYQGNYVDATTTKTFGDRVQTGTQRTIGGVRYLFVLNVQVIRNSGGRVAVRVASFKLDEMGVVTGSWPVARTALGADKRYKANGVFLTGAGFTRRVSVQSVAVNADGVAARIFPFMELAVETIKASQTGNLVGAGSTVQLVHGYGPYNARHGETYDTGEDHLLVFGGLSGATERLMK